MTRTALGRRERKMQKAEEKAESKPQNPEIEILSSAQIPESKQQLQNLKDAAIAIKQSKKERNKSYYAQNRDKILEKIHQQRKEKRLKKAEEKAQRLKAELEGGKAAESKAAESKTEESK